MGTDNGEGICGNDVRIECIVGSGEWRLGYGTVGCGWFSGWRNG